MKRVLAGIMTAALVITMGATSSMAASVGHGHHGGGHHYNTKKYSHCRTYCNYVDKDGDGYCDYCDYSSTNYRHCR